MTEKADPQLSLTTISKKLDFIYSMFCPILLKDGIQVPAQWVHTAYKTGMEK